MTLRGGRRGTEAGAAPARRSARGAQSRLVLKLGGELLEQPDDLGRVAKGIVELSARVPLVVVHGGGKEIDAALATNTRWFASSTFQPRSQKFVCATCLISGNAAPLRRTNGASA